MTGPSMLPTLAHEGEIVIEDRLTYRFFPQRISRGDLITLRSPLEPGRIVCKRIIGLPGDIVCVDPTGEKAPSTEHVIVPKGHVWISGDNAVVSRDSRDYGPVSMSLIYGRLIAKVSFITLVLWTFWNLIGLAYTRYHQIPIPSNYSGLTWMCWRGATTIHAKNTLIEKKNKITVIHTLIHTDKLWREIHRVSPLPIRLEFEIVSRQPKIPYEEKEKYE